MIRTKMVVKTRSDTRKFAGISMARSFSKISKMSRRKKVEGKTILAVCRERRARGVNELEQKKGCKKTPVK
jgi:hypothetical protein